MSGPHLIVLDANEVLRICMGSGGAQATLRQWIVDGTVQVALTHEIALEYATLATKPSVVRWLERKGIDGGLLHAAIIGIQRQGVVVTPLGEAPYCRDEDDRKYLHCAVAANASYLVTGDLDLLALGSVETSSIVTLDQFVTAVSV